VGFSIIDHDSFLFSESLIVPESQRHSSADCVMGGGVGGLWGAVAASSPVESPAFRVSPFDAVAVVLDDPVRTLPKYLRLLLTPPPAKQRASVIRRPWHTG